MLNVECWLLIASVLQVGAFSVLKELVIVLPDCLADHIGSLTPGIEKALCVRFYPYFQLKVLVSSFPRSLIS